MTKLIPNSDSLIAKGKHHFSNTTSPLVIIIALGFLGEELNIYWQQQTTISPKQTFIQSS